MEEKQKTKIAVNVSSGAEKVETVEKQVKTSKPAQKKASKKLNAVTEEKIDAKKMNAQSTDGRAEKESQAAKARVAAALKKKEEKARRAEARAKARAVRAKEKEKRAKMTVAEKRAEAEKLKAERKMRAEKRAAERKAKMEKRAAERKAAQEKHKAEQEAKRRERAHAKANRRQEKSKTQQKRTQQKRERKEKGGVKKGYGGWLAAVVSLGAVTLALTTAVTVGAIEMNNMQNVSMAGYQSTTYELIGIMEHVDDDLDRARVSASPVQQERILTDLLVQARLAELDLEKLPIEMEADRNLTAFINRVGGECERMLAKLRHGERLTEKDEAILQRLYETNHTMRQALDEYAANMTNKDVMEYMKKGTGAFKSVLDGLENLTLEENRAALEGRMNGAGTQRMMPTPSEDERGGSPKIDPSQAEELCKRYFADYKIEEFQCIGETVSRDYAAYNVQGYDNNGTQLFAEIDYNSGALIRFDYYEACQGDAFTTENAQTLAENFLQKLGYADMVAVRTRENGTDADFTFVYEKDGVICYPDTVRVKVCRARGTVSGLDAAKFLKNHTQRAEVKTGVTMSEAQNKLRSGIEVENARLAIVQTKFGERAAYEFLCSYMGERYLVYTDANNGEEIAILNIKNL